MELATTTGMTLADVNVMLAFVAFPLFVVFWGLVAGSVGFK